MKKNRKETSSYSDETLSAHDYKLILQQLDSWEKNENITSDKKQELIDSLQYENTGRQLAKYFFIIAVSSALLAFTSIFINDKFLESLKKHFLLSNFSIAITAAIISIASLLFVAGKRKQLSSFSYEMYLLPGGLAALTSLIYFCKDFSRDTHYTFLLLLCVITLIVLSILLRSASFWFAALVALCGWFGAFTSWQNHSGFFLGMNYPVRFALLGLIVLGFSKLQLRIHIICAQKQITYFFGLTILLTALWGISVFGNYANFSEWQMVRQTQVLGYSFIFAAMAAVVFWFGIKNKDETTRDIGLSFLLLNLYTRYFEFFWDNMNKGIFFLLLALSFWLLGKWIEKKKSKSNQNAEEI